MSFRFQVSGFKFQVSSFRFQVSGYMKVNNFEDLTTWQAARSMSKVIYQITNNKEFSQDIRFRSQIRAAAGSIMDNIAEGFERDGNKEFIQFLYVAKGSCGEVRSQIHRAADIGYITNDQYQDILQQTRSLCSAISSFISYLRNTDISGQKYKQSDN